MNRAERRRNLKKVRKGLTISQIQIMFDEAYTEGMNDVIQVLKDDFGFGTKRINRIVDKINKKGE